MTLVKYVEEKPFRNKKVNKDWMPATYPYHKKLWEGVRDEVSTI